MAWNLLQHPSSHIGGSQCLGKWCAFCGGSASMTSNFIFFLSFFVFLSLEKCCGISEVLVTHDTRPSESLPRYYSVQDFLCAVCFFFFGTTHYPTQHDISGEYVMLSASDFSVLCYSIQVLVLHNVEECHCRQILKVVSILQIFLTTFSFHFSFFFLFLIYTC